MSQYDCYFCAGADCCVYMSEPVPVWAANSPYGEDACAVKRKKKEKEMDDEARDKAQLGYGNDIFADVPEDDWKKEVAYQKHCAEMDTLDAKRAAEKDEDGLSQHEPGAKLDQGKVDIFRHFLAMFPDATECVAAVSGYGERKYSYMGWSKVSEGKRRYTAALSRHLLDEARGEVYDTDPEKGSDLPHAAQAAWNAMARLQLMLEDDDVEIRRGRDLDSSD